MPTLCPPPQEGDGVTRCEMATEVYVTLLAQAMRQDSGWDDLELMLALQKHSANGV